MKTLVLRDEGCRSIRCASIMGTAPSWPAASTGRARPRFRHHRSRAGPPGPLAFALTPAARRPRDLYHVITLTPFRTDPPATVPVCRSCVPSVSEAHAMNRQLLICTATFSTAPLSPFIPAAALARLCDYSLQRLCCAERSDSVEPDWSGHLSRTDRCSRSSPSLGSSMLDPSGSRRAVTE